MMIKKKILSIFLASVIALGVVSPSYIVQAKTISEASKTNNEEWKDPYQYGGETGLKEQKVDIDEISTM